MPRFFVKNEQIQDGKVKIIGNDAFHISRALRMAVGEHITVCDRDGLEYDCVLEVFSEDFVEAKLESSRPSDAEPRFFAHIYQGLPKGDKLDLIIQKAIECGAGEITTFESEFCIAKSKPDSEEKKLDRRNRIALEAAKQCGRAIIPRVNPTVSFDKMISEAKKANIVLFCYEGENTLPIGHFLRDIELKKILNAEDKIPQIAIIVGSEGGFSAKEFAAAEKEGFKICGLGKRILRTETAAMFALCCLVYETELS